MITSIGFAAISYTDSTAVILYTISNIAREISWNGDILSVEIVANFSSACVRYDKLSQVELIHIGSL